METIRQLLVRQNALDKQIAIDLDKMLHEYEPESTPFLTITSKMASQPARNTKVEWFNKRPLPRVVTYTGAVEASAGTSIVVPQWTYLREGTRLFCRRTTEIIRVTVLPTSSTVDVTGGRNWGSAVPGALLNTGDKLEIIGGSVEESATATKGRAILPEAVYNYVGTWEDYCQTSKEAELVETVTGQDLRQQSIDDMKSFHRKNIEMGCIFDAKAETTGTTYYIRTTHGLFRWITRNRWLLGDISDFTRLALDDYKRQIDENRPDRKDMVFVCSGQLKARIGGWAMNMLTLNDQKTKEFGMEINKYNGSTGGSFDVIEHPLFVGDYLSYLGFFLEWDKMKWRPLQPTKLELNTQEGYQNYRLDKISTIGAMQFVTPDRMGLIMKA